MRLFIALPVEDNLRHQIGEAINRLRFSRADIKWVEADNLHLTIKFLGEVKADRLAGIDQRLGEVAAQFGPLRLAIRGHGFFPNRQRPRVIWLGLGGDIEPAELLATRVDEALLSLGFPAERDRRWHLTLGRVRSERNLDALHQALPAGVSLLQGQTWEADHYSLISSTLTPRGPIYEEVHRYPLSGPGK